MNIAIATDSYKATHWKVYPPKMGFMSSYLESRGGAFKDQVFFGLQYILKEYFCQRVTRDDVEEAKGFWTAHFGTPDYFNYEGWRKIVDAHEGRLPLLVRALPEGTIVPWHNALMTIENTDPELAWLVNWMETLAVQLWYPMTVATNSREMRKLWLDYLKRTGDPSTVEFKLHDFGYRGSTSYQSAGIGAAAHLLSFMGTDTTAGIEHIRRYYGGTMPGFSIIATEHSTMTVYGEEHEFDAVKRLLESAPGDALVACVADSWDVYRFAQVISTEMKDLIANRKGTFILRPDSGDPATTAKRVLEILGDNFGYTVNSKGYKVLPPYIRMIWGDGIDYLRAKEILENLRGAGWSADNIAMGSGGGLLQKFDRDTLKFAFKCSYAEVNGEAREVYKRPVTDFGKQSKKGYLTVQRNQYGNISTVCHSHRASVNTVPHDLLKPVFKNGKLLKEESWDTIRERSLA